MKVKKDNLPTYLVADVKKISRVCPLYKKKFQNNLSYFYQHEKFDYCNPNL